MRNQSAADFGEWNLPPAHRGVWRQGTSGRRCRRLEWTDVRTSAAQLRGKEPATSSSRTSSSTRTSIDSASTRSLLRSATITACGAGLEELQDLDMFWRQRHDLPSSAATTRRAEVDAGGAGEHVPDEAARGSRERRRCRGGSRRSRSVAKPLMSIRMPRAFSSGGAVRGVDPGECLDERGLAVVDVSGRADGFDRET